MEQTYCYKEIEQLLLNAAGLLHRLKNAGIDGLPYTRYRGEQRGICFCDVGQQDTPDRF